MTQYIYLTYRFLVCLVLSEKKVRPGTIVKFDPRKRFIVVKTKNECIKILEWFSKLFLKENNIFYSRIINQLKINYEKIYRIN